MTNEELEKLLIAFKRLKRMMDELKNESQGAELDEPEETPFIIPPDIYDEICETMDVEVVSLFGIS